MEPRLRCSEKVILTLILISLSLSRSSPALYIANTSPNTNMMSRRFPKSRKAERETVKFRSSCDGCADRKVRCDKKQPHCDRCLRTGVTCRYSISMRNGKPLINLLKAGKLKPGGAGACAAMNGTASSDSQYCSYTRALENNTNISHNVATSSTSYQFARPDESCLRRLGNPPFPYPDDFYSTIHGSDPQCYAEDTRNFPSETHFLPTQLPLTMFPNIAIRNEDTGTLNFLAEDQDMFNFIWPDDGINETDATMPCANIATSMAEHPSVAAPDYPQADPIRHDTSIGNTFNQANPPQHNCLDRAKSLLYRVNAIIPNHQISDGDPVTTVPPNATDQAVAICSDVGDQLLELLECTCNQDAYLPFLIFVIICKVLETYGTIAADPSDTIATGTPISSPAPGLAPQQQQQQQQQQSQIQTAPLRFGCSYDADTDLSGLVRAQLVAQHMEKLKRVEDLFWNKYCGDDDTREAPEGVRGAGVVESGSGGDRAVYSPLAQFIRDRHARAASACASRIGRLVLEAQGYGQRYMVT
ncbi:hypothetical protein F4778DRAFT_749712 [Xylariomycetidae sp. FL2044]|nr:hypothetical protein F4778DRAFT_749712 [Xylariomycetidae sp. FL2044]